MGCQGVKRTRKLCNAQQTSMTRSRTPAFRRRQMSCTMRQRLTLLLTCSMRTRWRAMRRFAAFCAREGPASWLPRRHDHLHLVERERQEAEILEQPTARGHGVRGGIGNPLIVGTARVGLTQKEDHKRGIDQEHV